MTHRLTLLALLAGCASSGGDFDAPVIDVTQDDADDTLSLVATKTFAPLAFDHGALDLQAPVRFVLPETIPVTAGNASDHMAVLSFRGGQSSEVTCYYRGGSSTAHPVDEGDIAAGVTYHFDWCDNLLVAGETAEASSFELIVDGDDREPEVQATLALQMPRGGLGGPCDGGGWGMIAVGPNMVHVSKDGSDSSGDGSLGNPYKKVQTAVEAARALGPIHKVVAIGEGSFKTNALLDQPDDAGTVLMGCSPEATQLKAKDKSLPTIDLAVAGEVGVVGLTTSKGAVGIQMRNGAEAVISETVVKKAEGTGIALSGAGTIGGMLNVVVDKVKDKEACGWGVDVVDGVMVMEDSYIHKAMEAGVRADNADVVVMGTTIHKTKAGMANLGRGVHAQYSWLLMADSVISRSRDAGVFMLLPRGGLVHSIVIDVIGAGVVSGTGAPTGDGIVIVGDILSPVVQVIANNIDLADRAGVLFDAAAAQVSGNGIGGSGLFSTFGYHAFKQGVTDVYGPDAPGVFELPPIDDLDVDRSPLTCP